MATQKATDDTEYQMWMTRLDEAIIGRLGLSVHDLPDQPFRDLFDDGYEIEEAAEEIVQDVMEN